MAETSFDSVVGRFVEQIQHEFLLSHTWGSISTCVTGSVAIMFKKAVKLYGLDAWWIITRVVGNGMCRPLGRLRDEVRAINNKPVEDLEHVAAGIAEYEAKILEVN